MGIEGYYEDYFDERQDEKLTNFQKIKSMNLDEMAEFSSVFQRCSFCIASTKENGMTVTDGAICRKIKCKDGIKQWLQEESEE